MEKINWINGQSGGTPLSAENLNLMQDNAENAINEVATNIEQLTTDVENKHTYSTEEQVIGTWIDGKPLYRKVITKKSLSGEQRITTGLSNCFITKCEALSNNGTTRCFPIPFHYVNDYIEYLFVENNEILIRSLSNLSDHQIIFIIEYIKK